MNPGRSAIQYRCQDGQRYDNPFGVDITYDVPDSIDKVTHHSETDATASLQAFSSVDEWKRSKKTSHGLTIGIGSLFSLGSSKETQKVHFVSPTPLVVQWLLMHVRNSD